MHTPREAHVSSTPQLPRSRQSDSHTTIFMTELASASFDERLMEKANISNIMSQTDTTKENTDALQTPHPGDYCDVTLSVELSSGQISQLTDVSHTNPPPKYSKRNKRLRRQWLLVILSVPKISSTKLFKKNSTHYRKTLKINISDQIADPNSKIPRHPQKMNLNNI